MVTNIDRRQLIGLIEKGDLQLVQVLPEREFAEAHIPQSINIPLKQLDADTVSLLHRDKPVAVY